MHLQPVSLILSLNNSKLSISGKRIFLIYTYELIEVRKANGSIGQIAFRPTNHTLPPQLLLAPFMILKNG